MISRFKTGEVYETGLAEVVCEMTWNKGTKGRFKVVKVHEAGKLMGVELGAHWILIYGFKGPKFWKKLAR
jgi:hypothetical protein